MSQTREPFILKRNLLNKQMDLVIVKTNYKIITIIIIRIRIRIVMMVA